MSRLAVSSVLRMTQELAARLMANPSAAQSVSPELREALVQVWRLVKPRLGAEGDGLDRLIMACVQDDHRQTRSA